MLDGPSAKMGENVRQEALQHATSSGLAIEKIAFGARAGEKEASRAKSRGSHDLLERMRGGVSVGETCDLSVPATT
jgi:hypothetical protein